MFPVFRSFKANEAFRVFKFKKVGRPGWICDGFRIRALVAVETLKNGQTLSVIDDGPGSHNDGIK